MSTQRLTTGDTDGRRASKCGEKYITVNETLNYLAAWRIASRRNNLSRFAKWHSGTAVSLLIIQKLRSEKY